MKSLEGRVVRTRRPTMRRVFWAMSENLARDLFGGLSALPSGRRGRPAHRWSQTAENRVLLGLAMGYSDSEIASGIGVSAPTLRKYYFSALKRRDMQRCRYELWRAETLATLAGEGNIGAMKELGRIFESRDRRIAEERVRASSDNAPVEMIGKKEADRLAAERLVEGRGGKWGNLLDPSAGLH